MSGEKRRNAITAVLCAVGYFLILGQVVPYVYGIIDDRTMMEIISGQYLGRPDAHAIFSGYWYTLFLKNLYALVPQMDWYAFLYLVFQAGCTALILYRIWSEHNTKAEKIMATVLISVLIPILGMQAAVQLTFTTTAAVLGVTVLFWYITSEQIGYIDLAVLFFLGFLTCQVRESIFYMILPVCFVLWLFQILEKKERTPAHLLLPAAVIVILVLNMLGNRVGYGSEKWQAYHQYNMARSEVYDYADHTFPPYEGAEKLYRAAGIEKKSRARTLMNYNYTADDRITPGFFERYIAVYDQLLPDGRSRIQKLSGAGKEYVGGAAEGRFGSMHLWLLMGYVVLSVWYFVRGNRLSGMKVLSTGGAQICLWFYLIYEGRLPERVIYSMNLMLTVLLLLLTREIFYEVQISEILKKAGMFAAVLLALPVLAGRLTELRTENLEMYERNKDVEELKEYCMSHPENFYFNDVVSFAFTTSNVFWWKPEPYVMNYMSLGDWISFSPVWEEKLEQNGISSVREALYKNSRVYLICNFDKGLEYLEQLYDGVSCEEKDKVAGFHIYQLTEE